MTPKIAGLPDPRLITALAAAKSSKTVIRLMGRGGGTAAPGLIADRIDPRLLAKIARRLGDGSLVIAGTNGKTTTARMIADILELSGLAVAHNRSGSNLVRGVASELAARASWLGDPRASAGVFESDEAALPGILSQITPRVLVLNNLFRDQLDRYGELNTIARNWQTALRTLGPETTVVVNGDDPTLVAITDSLAAPRVLFGLVDQNPKYHLAELPHAVDAANCARCQLALVYDTLYSAHLGAWRCPNCGYARPPLTVAGDAIALDGVVAASVTARLRDSDGSERTLPLTVQAPGLYNVYNTIAATAAASAFGIPDETIAAAIRSFAPAFGRVERVRFRDRTLVMALVKNPVGFNETLRMLTIGSGGLDVPTLIAINDLHADGRDVSWLWDVDFELLAPGEGPLFTTGIRGPDMTNRLKYAGVPSARLHPLSTDHAAALDSFVASLPAGGTGYILPTYTAMLAIRKTLADLGAVDAFWRQ